MKTLPRILSALPGLLLVAALLVLLVSSLLRYAEAMLWLPQALRTVNISVLHHLATDLLIAMTLMGAAQVSRSAMPRLFIYFGLAFSLLMLLASVWQGFESNTRATAVRAVFWLIPISSLIMAAGFLRQWRTSPISAGGYFPVSMGEGGIKTALLFGATAFAWSVVKLRANWKLLTQYFLDSLDQYTLMAIPFLVLAGVFLNPQRRSGNLVPFALLALWFAAIAGVAYGKIIFSLLVPAAMVAAALQWSGAKNIVFAEHSPAARLMMHALVCALFVGSMMISFVSFTEAAALASFAVCATSLWIFRTANSQELPQIFSYSAVQSAAWLFTAAAVMLCVRLLGDASMLEVPWVKQGVGILQFLKIAPGWLLMAISIPVCLACYFIGPIAAILLAAFLLLPIAAAAGIAPLQLGAILLISLVLVKVIQVGRAGDQMLYPRFDRRRAIFLILIVLSLVAFMPKLSLLLPLLVIGPGS
ncbi:MAG: hypothetical protein WCE43_02060 [Burkholderiales bacterium]